MATKWGVEGGFAEWNGEDGEEKRWGEEIKKIVTDTHLTQAVE